VFGLAGSDDLREVERRADAGDAQARLALDVYVHRARACLASVAAALERVDALAFTGGVGEHSARIRANICAGLGVLGLPASLPEHDGADSLLSEAGASPAVLVVHAREDLEIAREAEHVLNRR
jgi:acetate kinase